MQCKPPEYGKVLVNESREMEIYAEKNVASFPFQDERKRVIRSIADDTK